MDAIFTQLEAQTQKTAEMVSELEQRIAKALAKCQSRPLSEFVLRKAKVLTEQR